MRILRPSAVLAVLAVLLPVALAAQESPEEVATAMAEAARDMDMERLALRVHPEELQRFRSAFAPLLEEPDAETFLSDWLEVETPAQAWDLSDEVFFARMMSGFLEIGGQAMGLGELMGSARSRVLGTVPEGTDTVHVVLRVDLEVEGVPISAVEVQSVARTAGGWGGLLGPEFQAFAAVMQAAVDEEVGDRIR